MTELNISSNAANYVPVVDVLREIPEKWTN